MNITPPIVGVPCLFLCHLGPTSLIVWPNFSLCKSGISQKPSAAVIPKAAAAVRANHVAFIFASSSAIIVTARLCRRGAIPSVYSAVYMSVFTLLPKVRVTTVPFFTFTPGSMPWSITTASSSRLPFMVT